MKKASSPNLVMLAQILLSRSHHPITGTSTGTLSAAIDAMNTGRELPKQFAPEQNLFRESSRGYGNPHRIVRQPGGKHTKNHF